jgi:hypothetical protein
MGPKALYLGPEVPAEELIWQDPIPVATYKTIDAADIEALKGQILKRQVYLYPNWCQLHGLLHLLSVDQISVVVPMEHVFV